MTNLPHLASKLFNSPLAIHPRKAEIVLGALAGRLGIGHVQRFADGPAWEASASTMDGPGGNPRGGYDVGAGVAVISIEGTLVQKLGTLRPYSGMTGYDGIRQNLLTALDDPEVKAILFDIDSPGGEVAGLFSLADMIYAARGMKPMWAMVNEMAYSAAYALASAADRIVLPRTGGVGSVGVITMHIDWSDAIDAEGLKVTIISFGEHKADGNPYERLPADVRARIQGDIDTLGDLFVQTVARNRGMAARSVRETEALCYLGADGVTAGLADDVMSEEEAFVALVESL